MQDLRSCRARDVGGMKCLADLILGGFIAATANPVEGAEVVLANLQTLFPMLGLEESLVLSAAPFFQRATAGREKCQIDLMIQTQRMLMVVEIKRRREIGHEIIDEVDAKIRKLKFA